ncbi:MAG: CpXC domain-containing protein, partial [Methanomicrobium sp.]|nr:CpXC domain-containing protein [Methanomicrobium sp.]
MEHSEKITCPDCGAESDFVIWQSINTMIDPETKAKVLSGEIFRFKCPKCGSETNIMYDCLYHQMEDKLMIQ